jgi:hypothetical protein
VVVENPEGKLVFFEKNAQKINGELYSNFNTADTPPPYYITNAVRPFEYRTIRISRANAQKAFGYAQDRTSGLEPFSFECADCANFASDVLAKGGLRNFGDNRPVKLWTDFINFDIARRMTYSTRAPYHPNDLVESK